MQDDKQYEQLMMQYEQLKNGALSIAKMIEKEDFDSAITMIKMRESIFLNCKCMRKYLEFTPEQQVNVNKIFEEIKSIEEKNIQTLEKVMEEVQSELSRTQKLQKLQKAYISQNADVSGSMVNIEK
jgi:ATP-dependent 26S proteasome regulatory subunit